MPKIVNTALKAKAKAKATGPEAKAKAKAIKFGLEAPRGQGLASRTTSLVAGSSKSPVQCNTKVYWIWVMPELLAFHVYTKLTGCTGVE